MDRKLSKIGIIKLINLYKSHSVLWDKNFKPLVSHYLRVKAYEEIGAVMGMSPESVKKKLHTLRSDYTCELRRIEKKSGIEGKEKYIPKLFYFSEMTFLDEFIVRKTSLKDHNTMCKRNDLVAASYPKSANELNISQEVEKEKKHTVKCTRPDKTKLSAKKFFSEIEENSINTSSNDTENALKNSNELQAKIIEREFYENKCRICLDEDVELDWNEVLFDRGRLTYKDCYYKYTQLQCFDEDNFSTMLCRKCANDLTYIDAFISKAIKTQEEIKEKLLSAAVIKVDEDNIVHDPTSFEEILVDDTEIKMEAEADSGEEFLTILTEERNSIILPEIADQPATTQIRAEGPRSEWFIDEKKECSKKGRSVCCSICSKVLCSKYRAIEHERTHIENRERNKACVKCGLKFFSETILKSHMKTHDENRQKPHKCEFCDKAFFNKGGLNVHLRIHLGQMIPCLMCKKEFYRQIDLDKHMATHSASRINSDIKLRKKLFVRCKDCGETVRTTNFKSHNARHNNKPLCKCSICDKEFFVRNSCTKHLRKFHKIASGETHKFIVAYKDARISQLFWQQYASDQINNE